jgi:hypothetical protein
MTFFRTRVREPMLLAVATLCLYAGELFAQVSAGGPAKSPAVLSAESLRSTGTPGPALRTLRQASAPFPSEILNELADSIVAFATDASVYGDPARFEALKIAIRTLGLAGVSRGDGIPYAGAGEKLGRIIVGLPPELTGAALYYLAHVADVDEAVKTLRGIAVSDRPHALDAIRTLLSELGPRGEAALRTAHEQGEARSAEAKYRLETIAMERGWKGQPLPRNPQRT